MNYKLLLWPLPYIGIFRPSGEFYKLKSKRKTKASSSQKLINVEEVGEKRGKNLGARENYTYATANI